MNKKLRQAFTLIELLVVIAIIGILSGLIIVGMNGMTQKATIAKAQIFSNSLRNSLMLNIVGEWKFDGSGLNDGDNATTAYTQDTWGGINNCSIGGTPKVKKDSNCVNGSCLQFNSTTSDYLDCGNGTTLNIGGSSVTVGLWIKLNTINAYHNILNKRAGATTWPYQFDVNNTNNMIDFSIQGTGYGVITSNYPISANTWYYIVGTRDATLGKLYLYINGVTAATSVNESVGDTSNNVDLFLGNRISQNYFNGLMDDIRIYNAATPTSQIKEQYYAGLNNLLAKGEITKENYKNRMGELAIDQP